MKVYFCALLFLCTTSALTQTLPDAPQPEAHHFWDKQNFASASFSLAARTADSISTCDFLRPIRMPDKIIQVAPGLQANFGNITYQRNREAWLPTQSCAGVSAFNAGFFSAGAVSSYWLHRSGHHRLERLPNWIAAGGSAYGFVYAITHKHITQAQWQAFYFSHLPPGTPLPK